MKWFVCVDSKTIFLATSGHEGECQQWLSQHVPKDQRLNFLGRLATPQPPLFSIQRTCLTLMVKRWAFQQAPDLNTLRLLTSVVRFLLLADWCSFLAAPFSMIFKEPPDIVPAVQPFGCGFFAIGGRGRLPLHDLWWDCAALAGGWWCRTSEVAFVSGEIWWLVSVHPLLWHSHVGGARLWYLVVIIEPRKTCNYNLVETWMFPTVGHRQGWCLIIFGHLYPIEDMKVCCVNQFDHLVTYSDLSVLLVTLHFLAFGNLFMFHDFLKGHFGTCCRRALLRLDLQILHFKTPMCPGAMGSRGQSERQWDRNQDLEVVSSSDWFRFMMSLFRRYLIAVDSLTAFALIINHQTMFLCFSGNRS